MRSPVTIAFALGLAVSGNAYAQVQTDESRLALSWTTLNIDALSNCYLNGHVKFTELTHYRFLAGEIEQEITRGKPTLDAIGVWQDARRNATRSAASLGGAMALTRHPTQGFCNFLRAQFASIYWHVFPERCPHATGRECLPRNSCGPGQECSDKAFAQIKKRFPEFFKYGQ